MEPSNLPPRQQEKQSQSIPLVSIPAPKSLHIQIMMHRLKVDEIVHADDRAKAREFECPICMSIPSSSSAVQTICCSAIFCTECLAPLAECPNCRAGWEPDTKSAPLPTLVQRMLLGLKVVCPNHAQHSDPKSQVTTLPSPPAGSSDNPAAGGGGSSRDKLRGKDAGCDWSGSYGDLLNKHTGECAYAEIDCPHGCGDRFPRRELSTHEDGCEKGYEECTICRTLVKIGGMAEHRREAAEMHVKILETQADGVKADVGAMKETLTRFSAVGLVIWKVQVAEIFETCKAKGDALASPEETLGTRDWFRFLLYATGHLLSSDGFVGLYVQQTFKTTSWLPGGVQFGLIARGNEFASVLRVCPWKRIFDEPYHGWRDFMPISDLRKASEIVVLLSPFFGRRQRPGHRNGCRGHIPGAKASRHVPGRMGCGAGGGQEGSAGRAGGGEEEPPG